MDLVYLDGGGLGDGSPHDLVQALLGPNELKGLRVRRSAVFVFADAVEQGAAVVCHGGDVGGEVLRLALGWKLRLRVEGGSLD